MQERLPQELVPTQPREADQTDRRIRQTNKPKKQMKPYYYVYRWNDKGPRVRHATLEAAQAEAMRLAEKHTSEYFEILKCVGFARTTNAATFWMDGEEPPKSGNPFRYVKPPEYY